MKIMTWNVGRERRLRDSVESHTLALSVDGISKSCEDLALDALGRQFGEQGGIRLYRKLKICPERQP